MCMYVLTQRAAALLVFVAYAACAIGSWYEPLGLEGGTHCEADGFAGTELAEGRTVFGCGLVATSYGQPLATIH